MWKRAGYVAALGVLTATTVEAQSVSPKLAAADSALMQCLAAVERKDDGEARRAADAAIDLYRAHEKAPETAADALTGRASVLARCRLPFASMMRQGAIAEESIDLLKQALIAQPTHFGARLSLGFLYNNMPAFLGHAADAMREFETLLEQYGDQSQIRVLATIYGMLADLYVNTKQTGRAIATLKRGLSVFPDDTALRERLSKLESEAATTIAAPLTGVAPSSAPQAYALMPIVVEVGSYAVENPTSATSLKRLDVLTAPGGAGDILQVFQMMPGVTRAQDGSDLYVRGGDPAEAPVFVDGARLFHPGTFESLSGSVFGVLDPSVLKSAYFSSGGFSARYGNALSGVLDVETDGRPTEFTWRAGVNLAGAGATMRAPIGDRAGAWFSASGTETSAMLRLHDRAAEYEKAPRAFQAIGSAAYSPRDGTELRISALTENDAMNIEVNSHGYRGPLDASGATRVIALGAKSLRADGNAGLRVTGAWSRRATDFRFGVLDRHRSDDAFTLRADADYARSARLRLRVGMESSFLTAEERGVVPVSEDIAPGAPMRNLQNGHETRHTGLYAESELRLGTRTAVIVGARADELPDEDEWTFDPRVALAYRAGDWTLRAGAGVYHQGRYRVRYRLPDGASPAGTPREAQHLAVGAQRGGTLPIRLEAYLKRYDAYVANGDGPQIESGRVAGVDALMRWTALDGMNGWLSYSLLDGVVQLADGRTARSNVDVTHTLTSVTKYPFGNWEIGTTVRYSSGRPITAVIGAVASEKGFVPQYGQPNSERLPDYFRIDSRLTRLQPIGKRFMVLYLEMLNLLDRRNVQGYSYDASYRTRHPIDSFFSDRTLVFGFEVNH